MAILPLTKGCKVQAWRYFLTFTPRPDTELSMERLACEQGMYQLAKGNFISLVTNYYRLMLKLQSVWWNYSFNTCREWCDSDVESDDIACEFCLWGLNNLNPAIWLKEDLYREHICLAAASKMVASLVTYPCQVVTLSPCHLPLSGFSWINFVGGCKSRDPCEVFLGEIFSTSELVYFPT